MSIAHRISRLNRERKWKLFSHAFAIAPTTTVLDVGFTDQEYAESDNYLEKHYPYPENITALGTDTPQYFLQKYPRIKAVAYDGKRFPFPDNSFDICWSNAVLEHVGDRAAQVLFLREIKRVARRAFVTVPNKYFPVEVHTRTPFLHWLPKKLFDGYLRLVGKDWATGTYMRLVSESQLRALLREVGIERYTIVKNKLLGFTLDFVVLLG